MSDAGASPGTGVPPIHHRPAHLGRRFQQICQAAIAEALAGHDLVSLEYGVLATLAEEPGIDQRRLAQAMGIDRNSTSRMVEALAGRGLVARGVDAHDRRACVLHLTDAGRALRDRTRPQMLAANARVLDPLSPAERDTFLALLLRVVDHNEALARPGAGRRPRRASPKPPEEVA